MKYLLCLLVQVTLIIFGFSQKPGEMLVPFESDGKWGYMNYDKKIVVLPVFDEAHPTYGLMGRIKVKGKYGYINAKGKIIIQPKYDCASDNDFGYVEVVKNGKRKYFNSEGKNNYHFPGRCGTGRVNLSLHSKVPFAYSGPNGKYGFIVKKRDMTLDTIPPIFDTVVSLANQIMYVQKEGKMAFTNSSYFSAGKKAILDKMDFKYDDIKYFTYERSSEIQPILGVKVNGLWGYYDVLSHLQGVEIIEPAYLTINSFKREYALVEYESGKFGYIDKNGKEYFWRSE